MSATAWILSAGFAVLLLAGFPFGVALLITTAVVLDPRQHPDLAAQQLRLLISQLQLLQQAAGDENLRKQLSAQDPDTAVAVRVLNALTDCHPGAS